ncbi:MAG: hypothetical protein WCO11_04385 [Sphingomonadales bacterium]|jgi:hypothetical protein
MTRAEIEARLAALIEPLAALEHERWAHWQRHLHAQGQLQGDGALLLPADKIARWQRQIDQPYAALSDAEQQSDREQVARYLPLLIAALADD